ncbi:tyrosinase family protein [Gilvimarinus sp. 1_MG-2023]|uniref:tyrosinase family protein n=1 Tax=Gilvimarinus sp. 1_MG-2023 TaxID=3062638 RepID=UPI0026E1DCB2|nr:tyrosinase family protein [Gilvimarinus sp. 1_MG-2023]MDO6746560.1 tyrosinase family protein [Gilvimarinus sp. 1_MG-2023]
MKNIIKYCLFILVIFSITTAQAAQYLRKNAATDAAQADIKALNIALKKMKAMSCDEPFSWYYQGATHSIPDEIKPNPLCPSYTQKADLKWAWATCTHKAGSEIHFLMWHRLYIAHFEKIVRKLSGKSDFALPYWNYTDPRNRVMPNAFRTTDTSLFEESRLPSLNNGESISSDMDSKLNINLLMKNSVFSVFNNNIDSAPHGAMHNYIGGLYAGTKMWNPIYQNDNQFGLMSHVPSAGFDPIFWLHHSNIDFIWQAWELSPNGTRPSLAELEKAPWPYQFFDENGKRVEYTIEEAYKTAFNIDYQYDQLQSQIQPLNSSEHKLLVAENTSQNKELVWHQKIEQTTEDNTIVMDAPMIQPQKNMELMLLNRPEALVIEIVVAFETEPHDSYNVFIVNGNGSRTLTGVMTFFGAAHHMQGHDTHQAGGTKTFTYDVSSEIPADGDYDVVIESQRNKDETLSVKSMSLYRY